jgi:hypothetical protein
VRINDKDSISEKGALKSRGDYMKSITAEKAGIDYEPTAILWSDTKPEGALQLKSGARTCFFVKGA